VCTPSTAAPTAPEATHSTLSFLNSPRNVPSGQHDDHIHELSQRERKQFLGIALARRGKEPSQLGRMALGMALAGASWIVVGAMQLVIDGGEAISIAWQVLPYILLTAGEVLLSATGLEFAYSQAPSSMKGVIMSFWSLAVTVGNLWVLIVNVGVKNDTVLGAIEQSGMSSIAFQMFFFAVFALVAALAFHLVAKRYRVVDNYRQ
jgi:POT family proton-dependent oligopeptide transporter